MHFQNRLHSICRGEIHWFSHMVETTVNSLLSSPARLPKRVLLLYGEINLTSPLPFKSSSLLWTPCQGEENWDQAYAEDSPRDYVNNRNSSLVSRIRFRITLMWGGNTGLTFMHFDLCIPSGHPNWYAKCLPAISLKYEWHLSMKHGPNESPLFFQDQ